MGMNEMRRSNAMEIGALVLGAVALLGCTCLAPAFLAAPIGITLALLSRGGNKRMSPKAKVGCILSATGLLAGIAMFASSLYLIMTQPEYREMYRQAYEQIYGQDPLMGLPEEVQNQLK